MNKNLGFGVMPITELKVLKSERDAQIIESFKATQSIRKTQLMLNSIWSREVIRRCITKAGLYDGCKREREMLERAKNRRCNPSLSLAKKLNRKIVSREFTLESSLVAFASDLLNQAGITHYKEVQVNGCQMRADLVGNHWAVEAKITSESQPILVAMAQAMVYKRHLYKKNVCILLPDDCPVKDFYSSECRHNGVDVVYLSNFIDWAQTKNGC